MYEQRLSVLCRGLAGCHGETIDGSSITYYDSRLRSYFGENRVIRQRLRQSSVTTIIGHGFCEIAWAWWRNPGNRQEILR